MKSFATTILTSLFIFTSVAFGEEQRITFEVKSSIEPSTAVGLIMNSDGIVQKPGAEITKESPGVLKVSFLIDSGDIKPNTFASAIVYSSEGDMALSSVRALQANAILEVPVCPPEPVVVQNVSNQIGLLQSLVSVRGARRENAKARVKELLSGDLLETIKKLEKGFGISFNSEISSDIHPLELIDRLTRVLHAIKNYRAGKPAATSDNSNKPAGDK